MDLRVFTEPQQGATYDGLLRVEADGPFTSSGEHCSLVDSPALPKPVQRPHPPVIVGGRGAQRTPRLAAGYADELNMPFPSLEATRTQYARVRAACQATGCELVAAEVAPQLR